MGYICIFLIKSVIIIASALLRVEYIEYNKYAIRKRLKTTSIGMLLDISEQSEHINFPFVAKL